MLFGRLIRKRIRVTPVLRGAVTSTAQQAGLANPPDRWRGLMPPDVTWLLIRPERRARLTLGDSHTNPTTTEHANERFALGCGTDN